MQCKWKISLIWSPRTEIFSGKRDFVELGFPKRNFRMENVRSICKIIPVPGRFVSIVFDPIFHEKKSWTEIERVEISIRYLMHTFTTTVDQPVFRQPNLDSRLRDIYCSQT